MTTTMASSSSPRVRSDYSALCKTHISSSKSLSSGFVSRYGNFPSPSTSRSVQFPINRPISPVPRSMSVTKQRSSTGNGNGDGNGNESAVSKKKKKKKTCMCSPTTHPGSFRCSLHRNSPRGGSFDQTTSSHSNNSRLILVRTAIANSLVRIGVVQGELMKRSLSNLIRPSSHQQCRRDTFQPRPSRLSVMSRAEDS